MSDPLRVGILCETSGVMRRAFTALGHDAGIARAWAQQWGGYALNQIRSMA